MEMSGASDSSSNGQDGSSFFRIPVIKYTKLFINGDFVHSLSGKTFETMDPRTGEVIAKISEGTKEDIDVAVKAAREAFDSGPWPRLPGAGQITKLKRSYGRGKSSLYFPWLKPTHVWKNNSILVALIQAFSCASTCYLFF